MVTMTCPWCEQDEPVAFDAATDLEVDFTCPDCGTSVCFVEEPAIAYDLAA